MGKEFSLNYVSLPNGETLCYRTSGEGDRTLLLIHGNTNSSKNWDLLMERLPDKYKIYAVDLRGFGNSTYNKPINSIKDFSDDIKLFVDALNIKDFILSGWSAGGNVAMQFVIDHPGYAKKLILLDSGSIKGFPMPKRDGAGQIIPGELIKTREEITQAVFSILKAYEDKNREVLKFICGISLYNLNKPAPERFEEYIDEMLKQRNLVDIDYALITYNISHEHNGVVEGTGEVDKITLPTLVIEGEKDILVTMDMAKDIANGIGENAKLAVIENSGHSPLVDNLDDLVGVYSDFIG